MSDWMAGLGAGLQSLGSNGLQYLLQEQERKRQQEKERQALERAGRERDQQFQQFAFQNSLSPYENAETPTRELETLARGVQSGAAGMRAMGGEGGMMGMGAAGVGLSGVGDALSQMAQTSRARLAKGRTLDYTDAQGKTVKYYQPYEQTEQGKKAAERQRVVEENEAAIKRMVASGMFTESEARAIMSSPENMRSAVLERVRPMPKGEPDKIVGPDGVVRYYRPPVMQPGETVETGLKQNITVPGQAPYNWTVQTDDTTGNVVLVDPRSGDSKPVTAPGGQEPLRNVPDAVKKKAAAFGTMRANIELLKNLVERNGIEVMPGEAKSAMESALAQAQVAWKTYAELGALSGPDMGLVIQAIGDPTSMTAGMQGGAKGILSKLNTALGALNKEEQLFTEMYKLPIPGRGSAPAGQQLTPQEQAIYDAAKMEGKSDAEIMAFLAKMRGGR